MDRKRTIDLRIGKTDKAIKIGHLETIRNDIRDEIKRRIEQRDRYSIQMLVALGAIMGFSFTTANNIIICVAPLVAIYYSVLILYSYRIHIVAAKYLREKLEPELAEVCGVSKNLEWENFYNCNQVPGIRRMFFNVIPWIVLIGSYSYLIYTYFFKHHDVVFQFIVGITGFIQFLLNIYVKLYFTDKKYNKNDFIESLNS